MNHIAYYLREMHFRQKTGELVIKRENIQKNIFFQGGSLIFAKSNLHEERFGRILVKIGKISEETYHTIEFTIQPKQKIGEIMIQKGLISQRDLYDGLIAQMREIILNLFPFFDAEMTFEERRRFVEQELESNISIPLLIKDGIGRMTLHPFLKTFMEKKIPMPKKKGHSDLLTEEEKKILGRIDGHLPSEALLLSTGVSPDQFWKSLYLIYCLDLIDLRPAEKIPSEEKIPAEEIGQPPSTESNAQLEEVLVLSEKLNSMNYYQILNVSREASETEIKKVYFHLAKKFHPDSFDRVLPPETKEKIEEVFDYITKAYRALSNREERKIYDSKLATAPADEGKDMGRRADIKFRQGKTLYNQGRYEDALVLLEEAVRLRSNKGDYYLLLAMAESKLRPFRKKAEEDFLKAVELEPWNTEAIVGLGLFYKQEGLPAKASRRFKRALEIDPEHKVALKELNLSGKVDKKKGLKGLFSVDFFGRKKK